MEHDDQDQLPASARPPQNLKKVTPASAGDSSSETIYIYSACGTHGSSGMSDPTAEPTTATAFNFDAVEGLRAQLLIHAPEAIRQLAIRNQWSAGELLQALQGLGDKPKAQSSADHQPSANDSHPTTRRFAKVTAAHGETAGTKISDHDKSAIARITKTNTSLEVRLDV